MGNQLLHIFGVQSVQNSVEVGPVWQAILCVLVLEVFHELLITFELGEDVVHTQLIVLGHVDELALRQLQELLIAFEDSTQEVSVCLRLRWYKELHYKESIG